MTLKEFFRNLFQAIENTQSVSTLVCALLAGAIIIFIMVAIVDILAGGPGVFALVVSVVFGRLIYVGFRGK